MFASPFPFVLRVSPSPAHLYLQGARVLMGTRDGQTQPGPQLLSGRGDRGAGGFCGHVGVLIAPLVQGCS